MIKTKVLNQIDGGWKSHIQQGQKINITAIILFHALMKIIKKRQMMKYQIGGGEPIKNLHIKLSYIMIKKTRHNIYNHSI